MGTLTKFRQILIFCVYLVQIIQVFKMDYKTQKCRTRGYSGGGGLTVIFKQRWCARKRNLCHLRHYPKHSPIMGWPCRKVVSRIFQWQRS